MCFFEMIICFWCLSLYHQRYIYIYLCVKSFLFLIGESIDAILNPVISRATTKKGRRLFIKLGDSEVEFHPNFKLFLHTKLSNPHYPYVPFPFLSFRVFCNDFCCFFLDLSSLSLLSKYIDTIIHVQILHI